MDYSCSLIRYQEKCQIDCLCLQEFAIPDNFSHFPNLKQFVVSHEIICQTPLRLIDFLYECSIFDFLYSSLLRPPDIVISRNNTHSKAIISLHSIYRYAKILWQVLFSVNRKLTEWPDRDVFSDGGRVWPGRNNPCGTKEQERDADQFRNCLLSAVYQSQGLNCIFNNQKTTLTKLHQGVKQRPQKFCIYAVSERCSMIS